MLGQNPRDTVISVNAVVAHVLGISISRGTSARQEVKLLIFMKICTEKYES